MAVPVISSTSTAENFDSTSNLTLTPPSGIQDGDILLLVAGAYARGADITCTGFTKIASTSGGDSISRTTSMYKVASSESGNYTVNLANTEGGAAVMFRITGDTTTLFNSDTTKTTASTNTTTKESPPLMVMFGHTRFLANHSTYSITDSNTNPTWTELYDVSDTSPDQSFFTAYATTTDTSDITAWSYNNGSKSGTGQLIVMLSSQDATATTTLLSSSPTINQVQAPANVTGTFVHLAPSPTINQPSGEASSKIWTTTIKS